MISINNLTKIYKSKKRNKVKALDNVSLTLPNSGLVFVLGKSGSGKSTLLNLIGGLDKITEGCIIVDGNDISRFKEKDFCDYRNTHIGFIFQDYHLIDELTIYDNICLSLNLRKIEDEDLVKSALKKVDLQGYENRFPSELSGGERQRVAIARAIVKKPRIILADEPTGNLDTITATAIVGLLKEISKECLILTVSHNVNDAYTYADRIIRLAQGKIILDETKNKDYVDQVTVKNNTLYYPINKVLDDYDIEILNKNMSSNTKLVKKENKFLLTKKVDCDDVTKQIERKRLSSKNELLLSLKFLKNKALGITLSSFMVSAIMIVLALAQTIISFDGDAMIANSLDRYETNSILIEKYNPASEGLETTKTYNYEATQFDKEKLIEVVENDENVYDLYTYNLPITTQMIYLGLDGSIFTKGVFATETIGTLVVNEEFLISKFGSLNYEVVSDNPHPSGVYITDYIADSILLTNSVYLKKEYKDLLGNYYTADGYANGYKRGYINGVIKTNYRDRYKTIIEESLSSKQSMYYYYEQEDFIKLSSEVYDSLGYCYSLNPSFVESFVSDPACTISPSFQLYFDDKELSYTYSTKIIYDDINLYRLKSDEIVMGYSRYNALFNTEYFPNNNIKDFTPHKVVITQYRPDDVERKNPIAIKEVTIKTLIGSSNAFICGKEIYSVFNNNATFVKGFYYNSNDKVSSIGSFAKENNFKIESIVVSGIQTMTKAVDAFVPIFELIAIVLCIGVVFILVNFSTKMIKDKMHEIGILKALGTQNKTVVVVFGLQIILIAVTTIIMSTIGYYIFVGLANKVLIESLKILAPSHIMLDLDFLIFKCNIARDNMTLIAFLAVISLIIPMVKIKTIKPVKIIKAKE